MKSIRFKKSILSILTIIAAFQLQGQIVMTNGGSSTTCDATFLDPGGTGDYPGGSGTTTYTICGDVAGQPLYLTFLSFSLWGNNCAFGQSDDQLYLYDGPNTSSPLIAGSPFEGTNTPGYVLGTSGCVTFRFVREDNGGLFCATNSGAPGWEVAINCTAFQPTGLECDGALPFCSSNTYNFQNSTDNVAQDGPDYGCLASQPNPIWYYMEIDQPGTIDIELEQTTGPNGTGSGIDVDFAVWGPYTDYASGCQDILSGNSAPIQCSFSPDPTEDVGIGVSGGTGSGLSTPPAAQSGEVYIFMITNYDGDEGYISFNQVGGTGSSDCSIVEPIDCFMSEFNINVSACNPDVTYDLTGDFTYTSNPGTGTIVVEVDNGTSTYTTTINPPFVNDQATTFSIPGIPADGAASTATVYFTDDPTCNITINFDAAANCDCIAEIGTFTATMSGSSLNNYVLCYGDEILFETNDDFVSPEEEFNPPGPVYDPGIVWFIYSCPPTVGLTPFAGEDINDDPCLLGTVGEFDLYDINDQSILNFFPAGTFTNNTVYFVPITVYSIVDGIYSYTNTTVDCYEMGQPYAVQYLPEITYTEVQDCSDGQVVFTLNGGLPALDGSNFNVLAGSLTPATASFLSNSTGNGGSLTLTGLTSGSNYSFQVVDANGCPITISGTLVGEENANFTYPENLYCANEPDPQPTVTGLVGGSFTGTAGLVINATNGIIDLSASTPGQHTVTYTTPSAFCPGVASFTLTIVPLPVVNAGSDVQVCEGQSVTLNATGATSYTWSNGIPNGQSFIPTVGTTNLSVTGVNQTGCSATDDLIITVNPNPAVSFVVDGTIGCVPLTVTFTNQSANSVNCVWDFGDGQSANGCGSVTHTFNSVGCFDVSLTVADNNGCSTQMIQNDMVCLSGYPIADFLPQPGILSTMEPSTNFLNLSQGAVTYVWDFGDGTGSNQISPNHTFPTEDEGNYIVTLYATNEYGCQDTAVVIVEVYEELIFYVPNTFTPDGDEFNNTFKPVFTSGFNPFDYNLFIYDRWGELIFESHDPDYGWDGGYGGMSNQVQDGVYIWKIDFKTTRNDARKLVTGHVTIIR